MAKIIDLIDPDKLQKIQSIVSPVRGVMPQAPEAALFAPMTKPVLDDTPKLPMASGFMQGERLGIPDAQPTMPTLSDAPIAARPKSSYDNLGKWGKVGLLASIFAGEAAKPGSMTPVTGQLREERVAQNQYDTNKPVLQQQANDSRDQRVLTQENIRSQISNRNTELNRQRQLDTERRGQQKATMLTQLAGELEAGKVPAEQLRNKYLRISQYNGYGVMPEEIDSVISGTKPTGPAFTVKDEGGYPTSIVRRDGTTLPVNSKDLTPEELAAISGYTSANDAKDTRQKEKEDRQFARQLELQKNMLDAAANRNVTKPPSEGERTALSFYERANGANKVLGELEGAISQQGLMGTVQMNSAPNIMKNPTQQQFVQAKRQFTQAKLRRESGAAISQAEYDQDDRTFFPQPGDSPEVLAQKKTARSTIMEELRTAAGRAYGEKYGDEAPKAGSVRTEVGGNNGGNVVTQHVIQIGNKKYRYNGTGSTADMKNYTEVKQ